MIECTQFGTSERSTPPCLITERDARSAASADVKITKCGVHVGLMWRVIAIIGFG
jgi:hypothetical protein